MFKDLSRITPNAKKLRSPEGDGADVNINDLLELAVSEVGISPSEFWSLSWFEWGCYLLRLQNQQDKEKFKWEESWEQTRIIWALIANVNGNKFKPQDLIKLPRDKDLPNTELTQERVKELEQLAKRRFGSTIKNGK